MLASVAATAALAHSPANCNLCPYLRLRGSRVSERRQHDGRLTRARDQRSGQTIIISRESDYTVRESKDDCPVFQDANRIISRIIRQSVCAVLAAYMHLRCVRRRRVTVDAAPEEPVGACFLGIVCSTKDRRGKA